MFKHNKKGGGKGSRIFGSRVDVAKQAVVPECLESWLHELEKKGALETEGLFRISGSVVMVKKLKEIVEEAGDKPVDYTDYTVHDVAGLTKLYFREMQEPLFTFDLYACFIAAGASLDKEEINKALELLPPYNRLVLHRLLTFLVKVVQLSNVNKMTPENLSTCLVPNLLRAKTETMEGSITDYPFQINLFTSLIDNFEFFFKKDMEEEQKKKDAIKERALNYKKMMEQKYKKSGASDKDVPPDQAQEPVNISPEHSPRPMLVRQETQEDLDFKSAMASKYKTINANTLKRLQERRRDVTTAMEFKAILEDQFQRIQSGALTKKEITDFLKVDTIVIDPPPRSTPPPTRDPPAPPARKGPPIHHTVPTPSFRLSLDAEKITPSEAKTTTPQKSHHGSFLVGIGEGGRNRAWTTVPGLDATEANPSDIKELLKTLPTVPDDLAEKMGKKPLSTRVPPPPPTKPPAYSPPQPPSPKVSPPQTPNSPKVPPRLPPRSGSSSPKA